MKPFTFSLQAVRILRQREEHQALEAFAGTVRARQAALDQQNLAERQLAAAFDQLTVRQSAGAPLYQLNQLRAHSQALEQRLTGCKVACAKAQEAAHEAWEKLQDVRQALELVNKLYDRQFEQHERTLREEEQKQLDEMSTRRWLLNTNGLQPATFAWN